MRWLPIRPASNIRTAQCVWVVKCLARGHYNRQAEDGMEQVLYRQPYGHWTTCSTPEPELCHILRNEPEVLLCIELKKKNNKRVEPHVASDRGETQVTLPISFKLICGGNSSHLAAGYKNWDKLLFKWVCSKNSVTKSPPLMQIRISVREQNVLPEGIWNQCDVRRSNSTLNFSNAARAFSINRSLNCTIPSPCPCIKCPLQA